jgi:hypothetical protein
VGAAVGTQDAAAKAGESGGDFEANAAGAAAVMPTLVTGVSNGEGRRSSARNDCELALERLRLCGRGHGGSAAIELSGSRKPNAVLYPRSRCGEPKGLISEWGPRLQPPAGGCTKIAMSTA